MSSIYFTREDKAETIKAIEICASILGKEMNWTKIKRAGEDQLVSLLGILKRKVDEKGEAEKASPTTDSLINEIESPSLRPLKPGTKEQVIERCGTRKVIGDGLTCTHCGAYETYKPEDAKDDIDRWAFVIRAFRVDDASECMNCKKWFVL